MRESFARTKIRENFQFRPVNFGELQKTKNFLMLTAKSLDFVIVQRILNMQVLFTQLTIINQVLKTKGKQKYIVTLLFKLPCFKYSLAPEHFAWLEQAFEWIFSRDLGRILYPRYFVFPSLLDFKQAELFLERRKLF